MELKLMSAFAVTPQKSIYLMRRLSVLPHIPQAIITTRVKI